MCFDFSLFIIDAIGDGVGHRCSPVKEGRSNCSDGDSSSDSAFEDEDISSAVSSFICDLSVPNPANMSGEMSLSGSIARRMKTNSTIADI